MWLVNSPLGVPCYPEDSPAHPDAHSSLAPFLVPLEASEDSLAAPVKYQPSRARETLNFILLAQGRKEEQEKGCQPFWQQLDHLESGINLELLILCEQ